MKSLLAFAVLLTIMCGRTGATDEFPNIILMMGDDHGWEETGYNGHPHVKTPVLDEMAEGGLRFDRFYAAHPTCSPTRSSFLTGRHPNRMGTFTPGWSIRPQEITMAHLLREAGYRCGHLGKWHVGPVKADSPTNPGQMGFDTWLSHDNFFEMDPPLSRDGGPPKVYEGESSAVLVRETIDFIKETRQEEKPFLAVVWFGSPHEPYSGLPEDLALYDDLPAQYTKKVGLTSNETGQRVQRPRGEVLRERYAEITAMDRAIGELRNYLKSEGLTDNTLLFYCGDNGTSADSALRIPHRGVKGQVYEGGILVPGVIEWPARIPEPRATKFRASTSDLLPTLCAILDQPLPDRPLDGIDLSAAIDGAHDERPAPLFFWQYNTRQLNLSQLEPWIDPALQKGTTPLVKLMRGKATRDFRNFHHPSVTSEDYRGERAIIDGDFKLVMNENKSDELNRELFNLRKDPAETTNLLNDKPETAAKLEKQLLDWQESVLTSLSGADYSK